MTKLLADLMSINGPAFHLGLQQLERSAGQPKHDIRLSSEINTAVRQKLRQLGLDGNDTTGQELYASLRQRLIEDELRFAAAIKHASSATDDPIAHIAIVVERQLQGQTSFSLKNAVAKKLFKAATPKKTMKALGYRSVDSMMKHESAGCLFAAAWLVESEVWIRKIVAAYGKLKATDFETRTVAIEHPVSKRWLGLAESVVAQKKHNILVFNELGTVVLLPLPVNRPPLPTVTTTILTLHAVNSVIAASSYLKMQQVKAQFGAAVQQVVVSEPVLTTNLLDSPVSWKMVQQYYARCSAEIRSKLFEPVVRAEDLTWHSVETVIARIEPSMEFWMGTAHLGMLDNAKPVSCNITDVALSSCNQLPFASRLTHNLQSSVRLELLLRYLSHERMEQTILGELHQQLVPERATA